MSKIFDSEFLNKLHNLVITSKILLSDGAGGNRKSRSKGSSVEFSDYREYSNGDDFRRIDWNAYGRFDKLFIKLFMEEREAPVHIFLDTSKSMDWGSPNKSILSRKLAAALSYISLSNYDRVTLHCLNDTTVRVKQSLRGKNSFGQVMDFLEDIEYTGLTDLYNCINGLEFRSSRGISIIISDLFSPGSLVEAIKYLQYHKQEIYICHLLAPQEINPQLDENSRLVDTESGEYRDVTAAPLLFKTYRQVYNRFISEVEDTCFKCGVCYLRMESSIPVEQMIKMVVNRP